VFLNSELAAHVGELSPELAGHVYFLEGYSQDLTIEIMNESIAAGDELMNPDIPASWPRS
jgi:hypothetical protein